MRRYRPPTEMQLAIRSGDEVELTNDFGNAERTRARSEPWQLGDGTWVVLVEGRAGGYDLERINPVAGRVVGRSAKTASEWASSIRMATGGELIINTGEIARVIALAQAEARRDALEEAERAVGDIAAVEGDGLRTLDLALGAIRALAAEVKP